MKKIKIIGVIVCILGAVCSVIYICSIYNGILTSTPLWMIIGFILLFWAIAAAVLSIICFIVKKHI